MALSPTSTQPYQILPGSLRDELSDPQAWQDLSNLQVWQELNNPQVWQDAALLFPFFNGDNNSHPNFNPTFPSNYANATGAEFARWHSAHQLAYLKDAAFQQTAAVPNDNGETGLDDAIYVAFADGVVAVLSADGNRSYVLNNLQPSDIARMPLADQRIIVAVPGFQTLVAAPYSLVPDTVKEYQVPDWTTPQDLAPPQVMATPSIARDGAKAIVNKVRDVIVSSPDYQVDSRNSLLADLSRAGEFYHYLFTEQLDLLDLALDNQAVFDFDQIQETVDNISERFKRLERYSNMTTPTTNGAGFALNMNSSHDPADSIAGDDTVTKGRDVFLRVESSLWEIAVQKAFVTNTGVSASFPDIIEMLDRRDGSDDGVFDSYARTFTDIVTNGPPAGFAITRLDGPGLLSTLQILENYRQEARAEAKSEELSQIDRLLKDYSAMQKMLNDTLKIFQPVVDTEDDDPEETLTLLNATSVSGLTTEDHPSGAYVAAMFDTVASTAGNNGHPEEQQASGQGYARPTENLAAGSLLTAYAKRHWDSLAVNLGDSTKLLGQENQVKMDEINQISKAKNRHYDLASNTINKLTELLRAINSA